MTEQQIMFVIIIACIVIMIGWLIAVGTMIVKKIKSKKEEKKND